MHLTYGQPFYAQYPNGQHALCIIANIQGKPVPMIVNLHPSCPALSSYPTVQQGETFWSEGSIIKVESSEGIALSFGIIPIA